MGSVLIAARGCPGPASRRAAGLCTNRSLAFGISGFGPVGFSVGFWVYGRWDVGPLAFETGNLKFQCKVRSSPKPNNAMPPLHLQRRAPKAEGLRAVGFGCWRSVLGRLPL